MSGLHTSTYKGKRVFIRLKDGTKFDDVFLDRTSRCVVLKERGRVEVELLKTMTIFREKPFRWVKAQHLDQAQAQEFPNLCPIQSWEPGTGPVHGGTVAEYTTCQNVLTPDGECEDHGKVRFKPYEKPEKKESKEPVLRHTTPRRVKGKRTRPRRLFPWS